MDHCLQNKAKIKKTVFGTRQERIVHLEVEQQMQQMENQVKRTGTAPYRRCNQCQDFIFIDFMQILHH